MASPQRPLRTVQAPIQKLDKCYKCGATTGLRLCSSCGERIYCSTTCQKEDWKSHKQSCKQTERIDLGKFWPVFAYQADACRVGDGRPFHPGITHKILNQPIPNTSAQVLPNGVKTNLVLLGDPIPDEQVGSPEWWPTAISDKMRVKLFQRIQREGHTVPILLSICVALLAEMYTTIHDPEKGSPGGLEEEGQFSHNKRIRLQCERNTIIDFGICKGEAEVKDFDTFGYLIETPDSIDFFSGQNPKNHYWIYFKTLREEFILDLSMFTFNMAMIVSGAPYWPHHFSIYPKLPHLAGIFITRDLRQTTPAMHYERKRFSILHDKALHSTVRRVEFSDLDRGILLRFMERVAGRRMSELEEHLLLSWIVTNRKLLISNLYYKEHLNYPEIPPIGVIFDPGEEDKPTPPEEEADAMRHVKKWMRLAKRGVIAPQQVMQALAKWEELPAEEKMAWRSKSYKEQETIALLTSDKK